MNEFMKDFVELEKDAIGTYEFGQKVIDEFESTRKYNDWFIRRSLFKPSYMCPQDPKY